YYNNTPFLFRILLQLCFHNTDRSIELAYDLLKSEGKNLLNLFSKSETAIKNYNEDKPETIVLSLIKYYITEKDSSRVCAILNDTLQQAIQKLGLKFEKENELKKAQVVQKDICLTQEKQQVEQQKLFRKLDPKDRVVIEETQINVGKFNEALIGGNK
ncbi:MAG: hypothetical protein ACD_82C00103G0001, partial [uncultured bacterium]